MLSSEWSSSSFMNYLMNSRDISEVTIVDKEAKEGHGVQRINATKVIFKLFYVHFNLYVQFAVWASIWSKIESSATILALNATLALVYFAPLQPHLNLIHLFWDTLILLLKISGKAYALCSIEASSTSHLCTLVWSRMLQSGFLFFYLSPVDARKWGGTVLW